MKLITGTGWLLAVLMMTANAQPEHLHGAGHAHGAHIHGVARVTLLQDAGRLQMEFVSPAINVVGFEHKPQSAAESVAVDEALLSLQDPDSVLLLTSLGCPLARVRASITGEMANHTHEGEHSSTGHSAFSVIVELDCEDTRLPTEFDVTAFGTFPRLEMIEIQWALAQAQGAQHLPAGTTRLRIDR